MVGEAGRHGSGSGVPLAVAVPHQGFGVLGRSLARHDTDHQTMFGLAPGSRDRQTDPKVSDQREPQGKN